MDLTLELKNRLEQLFQLDPVPPDVEIARTLLAENFAGVTPNFVYRTRIDMGYGRTGGRPKEFVDPVSSTLKMERTSRARLDQIRKHPKVQEHLIREGRVTYTKEGKVRVSRGRVAEHMIDLLHSKLYPNGYPEENAA